MPKTPDSNVNLTIWKIVFDKHRTESTFLLNLTRGALPTIVSFVAQPPMFAEQPLQIQLND